MAPREILDDFSYEKKQGPTILQRIIRMIEVIAWIVFFLSIDQFSLEQPLFYIALTTLLILYLVFPIYIFRSKGFYRNIVSHLIGLLMIPFLLGFLYQFDNFDLSSNLHVAAGFSSLAGVFALVCFMIRTSGRINDHWYWLNMIVRLLLVVVLTTNAMIYFILFTFF